MKTDRCWDQRSMKCVLWKSIAIGSENRTWPMNIRDRPYFKASRCPLDLPMPCCLSTLNYSILTNTFLTILQ